MGDKLGLGATIPPVRDPGEGFKRPWPPLIKMDEAVKAKVEKIMANQNASRIQAASPQ